MSRAFAERLVDGLGRVVVTAEDVFELLYAGIEPGTLTAAPGPQIERFNALCRAWDKPGELISAPETLAAEAHRAWRDDWAIPEPFATLDVRAEVLARCSREDQTMRVAQEMALYEARDLLPLLRQMFALVDHFRANGVVWGVGRGSSVASYVLYLIGIHKIDSLKYGLDIGEFLKPA